MRTQAALHDMYSAISAQLHASTQYEGERWACVLGGGWLKDIPGGAICY